MSKNRNYSVGPHRDGGWQVKRDGAERASSTHDKKADAIERGRELARKAEGELRIKGKDGKIQDSDSYGKDPNPPVDKKP